MSRRMDRHPLRPAPVVRGTDQGPQGGRGGDGRACPPARDARQSLRAEHGRRTQAAERDAGDAGGRNKHRLRDVSPYTRQNSAQLTLVGARVAKLVGTLTSHVEQNLPIIHIVPHFVVSAGQSIRRRRHRTEP